MHAWLSKLRKNSSRAPERERARPGHPHSAWVACRNCCKMNAGLYRLRKKASRGARSVRARLQSCRKCRKLCVGLQPLRDVLSKYSATSAFLRSLFSPRGAFLWDLRLVLPFFAASFAPAGTDEDSPNKPIRKCECRLRPGGADENSPGRAHPPLRMGAVLGKQRACDRVP